MCVCVCALCVLRSCGRAWRDAVTRSSNHAARRHAWKGDVGKLCKIGKVVDINTCMQRTLERYVLGMAVRVRPPQKEAQTVAEEDCSESVWFVG